MQLTFIAKVSQREKMGQVSTGSFGKNPHKPLMHGNYKLNPLVAAVKCAPKHLPGKLVDGLVCLLPVGVTVASALKLRNKCFFAIGLWDS